jgi:pyruvate dehydrogenase E2 component (dihydrolipoamide acetyltransferase)
MSKMSTRRKLAIATWGSPREGNIYGKMTLDATPVLEHLDRLSKETGVKVTMTHFIGKIVAEALANSPGLNGFLRFGVYHQHQTVDVSFIVNIGEGADLGKVKVENLDRKSIVELARELRQRSMKVRRGKDEVFERGKGILRSLPTWALRPTIGVLGWLSGSAGLELRLAGLERFPFGASVVSNVGMFGLDEGYMPPTPFAHVPLYVLIGAIREQPSVVDGDLTIRKLITISATVDHRFVDGYQAGVLAETARACFANPACFGPEQGGSE